MKPAAAMLSVGLLAGACSSHESPAPAPRPTVETPAPGTEPITGEPEARARALAALAFQRFERGANTKKPPTTWVFKNLCAVFDEDPGTAGPHTIYVVPNPGVLRITDKQTGNQVAQDFGWDQIDHKYVFGKILAIDGDGQSYGWIDGDTDESSIHFDNYTLVEARLRYSKQRNILVHGHGNPLYGNVVAVSGDTSVKTAVDDQIVNKTCAAILEPSLLTAPPPSEPSA
ncbi:MAG TPA: hypothetical protein VHB51_02905 [Candidatus Saccharimonadales bacterium]|nr:hypothetical protein [Candidatus Saccharimonadales bacterium]